MFLRLALIAALLAVNFSTPTSRPTIAAEDPLPPGICFPETGKCMRGLFYGYWVENGGLYQQGFPLTDDFMETSPLDGKKYRVQYFERARFEYHSEKLNTPYVVELGLLAREQFEARYPKGRPAGTGGTIGSTCFEATNRCIKTGAFLDTWKRLGGLPQNGYPISDEFEEVSTVDGKTYTVQYFERARFEYHPEFAKTPSEVLLGLLGREAFEAHYPKGQPPAIDPKVPAVNIYANTLDAQLSPAVANSLKRVYVPNELSNTVDVINPDTLEIVDHYSTGAIPHHATPVWDMSKLLVNNMGSSTLSQIDPATGKIAASISVPAPYNLYFTPDGTKAIVAAEPLSRLNFYDPKDWKLLKSIYIPWPGIDHMDMSASGRYLFASTEFSGIIVKIDTVAMEFVGALNIGGLPVDIRFAADGSVFYVANQGTNGVHIIDPVAFKQVGFIPTGAGAHGLCISRDTKSLYVSNRYEGTISVIDFESRTAKAKWKIGGSPDMLQVSPDGSQLWASGRYNAAVYVIDTREGKLIKAIPTGAGPHGIAYFPQPGRISIGHNGVYR